MSSRVTRSSARRSAGSSSSVQDQQPQPPARSQPTSRKRKASYGDSSGEAPSESVAAPSRARSKRTKIGVSEPPSAPATPASSRRRKNKGTAVMSSSGHSDNTSPPQPAPLSPSSRRRSGRKKDTQGSTQMSSSDQHRLLTSADSGPSSTPHSSRRKKKSQNKSDEDVTMRDDTDGEGNDDTKALADRTKQDMSDESNSEEPSRRFDEEEEDDEEDVFAGGFLGGRAHAGLSSTLRALSGMVSGISSRLRNILENLKQKDDPSVQLIALQELSELLLISTEDNLAGHFSPDLYVKELVSLMQPDEFEEDRSEIMLLACRCLANLMEALPAATANVVYSGAVPVLCQKLLEISYIDLAEQALSTLEKISVEFPAAIVREGGLTACLAYLDFFATSTQRTAVTTAANCCRNIPEDCFGTIKEVMPTLLTVLNSNDQKVVEQGCLCVSRIVESFRMHDSKLEELVSAELLRAVLRLLLPGTTNLIGPHIHTMFLRVLSITARASPIRSVELFQMDVVDTLYQILTGVSPPAGTDDIATKIDSVVIMQALIHRPREQVYETLNVICELLPTVHMDDLLFIDELPKLNRDTTSVDLSTGSEKSPGTKRLELLEGCKKELRRFAVILLPTLTDAYSSTVNLNVRQQVLTAQLKMLSNLDIDILEDALRPVPYASYLASILSQQDHPTLVTYALQAAELLLKRLESIYRYQFYREGVISEITRLANRPTKALDAKPKQKIGSSEGPPSPSAATSSSGEDDATGVDLDDDPEADAHSEDDDDDPDDADDPDDPHDDGSDSDSSSSSDQHFLGNSHLPDIEDLITLRAKKFLEVHEQENSQAVRDKAGRILDDLKCLATDIEECYSKNKSDKGRDLFRRLAVYFDGDALDGITSYELLTSNIVEVLLKVFSDPTTQASADARAAFLEAVMGPSNHSKPNPTSNKPQASPFSVLVGKLQDLLSRAEHFEVVTVHHGSFDSNRSSPASMLAKQIRLKLVADDDSGIPRAFRNIMVSIHAIATFKALDDYLRPRINFSERPRGSRSAIAAYAAALSGNRGSFERRGQFLSSPVPSPADHTNRNPVRPPSQPKAPIPTGSAEPSSSGTGEKASNGRWPPRKRHPQVAAPPPPAVPKDENDQETLECADEAQLTDEDDLEEDGALNAIVGDLEENMEEDEDDPSAVNVEVASSGKVTARKEDGTRVATPVQTPASARPSPADRLNARMNALSRGSPSHPLSGVTSLRPSSYAAAIQSVPQDWHIEFSVNDQPISNDTTIYRAVHFNQAPLADIVSRPLWSAIHTIKFKKAAGPPPAESTSWNTAGNTVQEAENGLPASLAKHPATASILSLLSILHGFNANLDDVVSDEKEHLMLKSEPVSQFVNTKLTAKLNRQLEEPLIVASNCLPTWSEDLPRLYPFLFPFETRHLFLQSTSFGYSRSMTRWQNAQATSDSRHDRHHEERPFLGRLLRQKVRISRTRILESAVKVMELYGSSPSILEVEYFEEVGTGLGPTLEFYSTVSKEFAKKKLKLWRENESNEDDEYAFGARGLFPAPMSEEQANTENGKRVLNLFKMLGKFVARSMLDSRIIDISFNPTFFRIGDGTAAVTPSLGAVKSVDSDLARSLKLLKKFAAQKKRIDEDGGLSAAQKVTAIQAVEVDGARVDDLGLDFTLPGYPDIQLIPNGSNVAVTIDNVSSYVDKVLDYTLGSGVQRQVDAFRTGFSQVFPYSAVKAFTPDELVMLYGRIEEDWSLETLMDSIKADHGYNLDSKSVRNLLQVMSELSPQERRDFLQFVTGSPKLPIGGFKRLTPMFTVVCKASEPPYSSDDYLPSVMTCVNYLKMPDYTTMQILKEKLFIAIKEGQGAFHLS